MCKMKNEKNLISESILDSISATEKLKDIPLDLTEIALDNLIDNDVVKELPIMKYFHAVYKTSLSIRDKLLLKKIILFLVNLQSSNENEKREFIFDLEKDSKFRKKVGEQIVLLLEKLDNLDKPAILSTLFLGFMKGTIDYESFLKLSHSVDTANISYLREMDKYYKNNLRQCDDICLQNLYGSGLISISFNSAARMGYYASAKYVKNKLGYKYIRLLFPSYELSDDFVLILPQLNELDNVIFKALCEQQLIDYPYRSSVEEVQNKLNVSLDDLRRLLLLLENDQIVELQTTLDFRGSEYKIYTNCIAGYVNECIIPGTDIQQQIISKILAGAQVSLQIAEELGVSCMLTDYFIELFVNDKFIITHGNATNGGYLITEIVNSNNMREYYT